MAIFKKPAIKIQDRKKRDIPQGLFQKCPGCDEVIHEIELIENQRVCPHCDYHFPQTAKERIESLLDPGSFVEMDANLHSVDTLRFQGMASLMQMAKTSGALARHADARLPYISVLTNPTTAGVMASYASLGDIIIAEPKSMIGFAGPRVIKETTHQDLPKGFQTAEFLEEHGLIDQIVHRKKLRSQMAEFLRFFAPTAA